VPLEDDLRVDASRVLKIACARSLLGAATTLVSHRFGWDYGGALWRTGVFSTSLPFLDSPASALLVASPRVGGALATAFIESDIAHNAWILPYMRL
jgi:hypothetical protein